MGTELLKHTKLSEFQAETEHRGFIIVTFQIIYLITFFFLNALQRSLLDFFFIRHGIIYF